MNQKHEVYVRNTRAEDFPHVIELCREVYPAALPWRIEQLASHLRVFPEGQFVAVERGSEQIVGMAACLIIRWDDYEFSQNWRDFTESGMFTNHDPENGHTLYGAEIMVRSSIQRRGIGSKLYTARRRLVERLGLLRIRSAARLRGFHKHADRMSAEEYVIEVVRGVLKDPTLSFQIKHGFEVLAVVANYLFSDPESLGYAAVIEWINQKVARPEDFAGRDPRFRKTAASGAGGGRGAK